MVNIQLEQRKQVEANGGKREVSQQAPSIRMTVSLCKKPASLIKTLVFN